MKKLNRDAELGDRVYLASYQHYWLRGDLLQCLNNQNDHFLSAATGDRFWLELYQKGFKYILIDEATHGSTLERLELKHVPEWVKLKLKYKKMSVSIYEMKFTSVPSAVQPAVCQRLSSSTIWKVILPYYPESSK